MEEEKLQENQGDEAMVAGNNGYENFNPESPYDPGNSFKPSFCVNLKTGDLWAGGGKSYLAGDGSGWLANKNIAWDAEGDNIDITGFLNGAVRTPSRNYELKTLNYFNIFRSGSNDFFVYVSPGQSGDRGLTIPSSSDYIGLSFKMTLALSSGTYGTVQIVPEDTNTNNYYMRWRNKKFRYIILTLGAHLELRGIPRFESSVVPGLCDWVVTNASDFTWNTTSEGIPFIRNIVV